MYRSRMLRGAASPAVSGQAMRLWGPATAPLARYAGAMLALMFVVSGVRAEPAFSFDATPGKLPKTVVSIDYSIELNSTLRASRFCE
jgi:hypothetical protein